MPYHSQQDTYLQTSTAAATLPTAPDAAPSHEEPKPEPAQVAEVAEALVAVGVPEPAARRYALSTEYVFALAYLALIANILARGRIDNPVGLARSVFDRPQQYPEYRAFLPHARVSRENHKPPPVCLRCGQPFIRGQGAIDGSHFNCSEAQQTT
jgi:hypothetical protein